MIPVAILPKLSDPQCAKKLRNTGLDHIVVVRDLEAQGARVVTKTIAFRFFASGPSKEPLLQSLDFYDMPGKVWAKCIFFVAYSYGAYHIVEYYKCKK